MIINICYSPSYLFIIIIIVRLISAKLPLQLIRDGCTNKIVQSWVERSFPTVQTHDHPPLFAFIPLIDISLSGLLPVNLLGLVGKSVRGMKELCFLRPVDIPPPLNAKVRG